MSIHVCKCEHNGRTEFHLRYPGMDESVAQRLADRINGGEVGGPTHRELTRSICLAHTALSSIAGRGCRQFNLAERTSCRDRGNNQSAWCPACIARESLEQAL